MTKQEYKKYSSHKTKNKPTADSTQYTTNETN